MRKLALIPFVLSISACSVGFLKYDSLPVVQATVTHNATMDSVVSAGGQPDSKVSIKSINGTCLNYTLRKDGESMPFFVVFNKDKRVTNYGYVSCETAQKEGYKMPSEPMKQRF